MNLRAHLGDELFLFGEVGERAGFEDGVRERLFAVHVLAETEGHGRGRGVRMVGGADADGVDIAGLLFEHDAEIAVFAGVGIAGRAFGQEVAIDVGEGDDLLARELAEVGAGAVRRADAGDAEALAGRFRLLGGGRIGVGAER